MRNDFAKVLYQFTQIFLERGKRERRQKREKEKEKERDREREGEEEREKTTVCPCENNLAKVSICTSNPKCL